MLLHWPCETLADTVSTYRALQPLVASGRARAIGVSNMNATFLARFLADPGVTVKPAVDQCGYSIHGHGGNAGAVTPLGTALSRPIFTILTALSWICVGIHMCGALPSPCPRFKLADMVLI